LFPETGDLQIDLSGVTQVDSSALALLIEWLRQARQRNHSIRIEGAPDKLLSIARLTDVQDIILNK
jgi:phospholipid transport system transporter-binding protein